MKFILAMLLATTLLGCQSTSLTRTTETRKSYVIYNIEQSDSVTPTQMAKAIKTALQESTTSVRIIEDLPPYPLPEVSPRFTLVNPFSAKMSALAGGIKIPTCEGSLVFASATDDSYGSSGENTQFYTCLWQYKDGYHVDIYIQYQISHGGLDNLGKDLVREVMGDSSQFIPRTIRNIKNEINSLNVDSTFVTAYPDSLANELKEKEIL
jgi:hypothetical protein